MGASGPLSRFGPTSVFLNGFGGAAELDGIPEKAPELLKVFRRVLSSPISSAVPSELALNGSSDDSVCRLSKLPALEGGGDTVLRDEGGKRLVTPLSSSELAEWGEMIRTVLPALDLGGCWTSVDYQQNHCSLSILSLTGIYRW